MPIELPNFRDLRVKSGLNLREVETLTGISNSYLSQLENGKIKKPSFETVQTLVSFYQTYIKPKKAACPNCRSEDFEDVGLKEHNGIIGPGSFSIPYFEAMCCNNCGNLFRIKK